MDPLGATASVITLFDVAIKTYNVVHRITRRYKIVPAELSDLAYQLQTVKSQIGLLQHLQKAIKDNGLRLDEVELATLSNFIKATISIFSSIHDHFEHQAIPTGPTATLKWVLRDSSKIKAWESDLRRHSTGIANVLLLMNM